MDLKDTRHWLWELTRNGETTPERYIVPTRVWVAAARLISASHQRGPRVNCLRLIGPVELVEDLSNE